MGYGKSLKLNNQNDLAFDKVTNSLKITTTDENLTQAIKILLHTFIGELKFYPDFGVDYYQLLGKRISDNNIQHSIESSLIRDPRIKSVEYIEINRDGRILKLSISVKTTAGAILNITETVEW